MNFVNHQQLLDDVRIRSQTLPNDLVAVAGVPRSGLLPALHLALHRNLHLVSLNALISGESPWGKPLRRGVPAKSAGRVLIVDDSINSGETMLSVRDRLSHRNGCLFGAVYRANQKSHAADFTFREVPTPPMF